MSSPSDMVFQIMFSLGRKLVPLLPRLFLLEERVVWRVLLVQCLWEMFLPETFSSQVEGLGELVLGCLECQCALVGAFGQDGTSRLCWTLVSEEVPI